MLPEQPGRTDGIIPPARGSELAFEFAARGVIPPGFRPVRNRRDAARPRRVERRPRHSLCVLSSERLPLGYFRHRPRHSGRGRNGRLGGMTGLSFLHGVDSMPAETFAQVSGMAKRIPRLAFKRELLANSELMAIMNRYAQFWMEQSSRSISCNGVHAIEARCARWLLVTHDRVESDVLLLTQEFLSVMLAVRRASVSVAAESLRKAGLISYSRGKITVLDRRRLEAASCDCYAAIQLSYDRLLPRKRRRT